jgi:hypothetical protein
MLNLRPRRSKQASPSTLPRNDATQNPSAASLSPPTLSPISRFVLLGGCASTPNDESVNAEKSFTFAVTMT